MPGREGAFMLSGSFQRESAQITCSTELKDTISVTIIAQNPVTATDKRISCNQMNHTAPDLQEPISCRGDGRTQAGVPRFKQMPFALHSDYKNTKNLSHTAYMGDCFTDY